MMEEKETPEDQSGAEIKTEDIITETEEQKSAKAAILAKCLASADTPVEFIPLFSVESKAVDWLIPNMIPLGMYTTFAGESGIGKSNFVSYLASLVTQTDAEFNGCPIPRGRVIIWSPEESFEYSVAPRLRAFGAKEGLVHFISGKVWPDESNTQTFKFEQHLNKLTLSIEKRNSDNLPYRLLIIDPITSGFDGDMNQVNHVRQYLEPLKVMAEQLNIAIVGVTHFTKGRGMASSPQDMVIGSQAFSAVARVTLGLFRDKQTDNRRLVILKTNITDDRVGWDFSYQFEQTQDGITVPKIEFIGQVQGDAKTLIEEVTASEEGSELDDAMMFLKGILHDAPLTAKQVKKEADDAGHSWTTIRRASQKLGIEKRKDHGANGAWRWALPGK